MLADPKVPDGPKASIQKIFDEAPRVDKFLYNSFNDLETERPYYGMAGSAGRLPILKIIEYGKHYGLQGAVLEDFIRDILRVDQHLCEVIMPKKAKRDARSA